METETHPPLATPLLRGEWGPTLPSGIVCARSVRVSECVTFPIACSILSNIARHEGARMAPERGSLLMSLTCCILRTPKDGAVYSLPTSFLPWHALLRARRPLPFLVLAHVVFYSLHFARVQFFPFGCLEAWKLQRTLKLNCVYDREPESTRVDQISEAHQNSALTSHSAW